jgi:diguanylate cyclase (GGDEF)-like protein
MGGGGRSLALLLFTVVALATLGCSRTPASVQDTAEYSVRLLDLDGDAQHAPALASLGRELPLRPMPRSLPYAREGSWVVVQLHRLPPDPRLVVEGQVAEDVTLVLPDGRRFVRAKLRPGQDEAASSVALVYALPPGLRTPATLRLHFRHQHLALAQVQVLSASQWRQRERSVLVIAVVLYTALGCFALVSACFWLVGRERMYAEYTLFLASWLAFMASNSGLLYVMPGLRDLASLGIHGQWMLVSVCFAASIAFGRDFLDIARNAPKLLPVFNVTSRALYVGAVVVALSPWAMAWYGMTMSAVAVTMYPLLVLTGAWIALRTRDRYAWYFLAGWIPMTVGSMTRALQTAGLVAVDSSVTHLYATGVLLQAAALVLGLAERMLRTRRERDQAQLAAAHDALTGVLNRRAFDARLHAACAAAKSGGPRPALLFLDIDHFKGVNDNYGHAGGDACLIETVRRVQAQLADGDSFGRWGGEEFVVLLPSAGLETARKISEAIRHGVAARPVLFHGHEIPLTISIGIAAFDPDNDDAIALTARADAALYRAKERGRNRVEAMVANAA